MWDTSCLDWRDRILGGRSLVPELPLYKGEAEMGLALFNELQVMDAIGQPKLATAGAPWFKDIVKAFFGAVNPATNERMIRHYFIQVAKKNGKTIYSAALMLTALMMNERPNAVFVIVAPSREQAAGAFDRAAQMASATQTLKDRFHVLWHDDAIRDRKNGSELRIKTFDTNIVTGAFPAGVLIDEKHLLGRVEKAERVMGQLTGGMLPDPSAFIIDITTQSDLPPAGVYKADLEIARQVRDGKVKRPMLPIIYEFPEELAKDQELWKNPKYWHMVNPNIGRSVTVARLEEEWEGAKLKGEAKMREWASQHLNIEMGIGMRVDGWKGARFWEAQIDKTLTLDEVIERSRVLVMGVDDGGLDDLLGCCVLGEDKETGDWLCWTHGWAHEQILEERKSIATVLRDAEEAGELTISDDRQAHFEEVAALAERLNDTGKFCGVAVDPATVPAMISEFAGVGIQLEGGEGLLKPVKQGMFLMQAIKGAEIKLSAKAFWHGGSALMNFCITNLKIEPTATAIRPVKISAGDKKIDLAMALFDAVTLIATNPQPKKKPTFQAFVVG